MKQTPTALCAALVAAGIAAPAFAALGADSTSVQSDLARMKGSLRVTAAAAFTVHEITANSGTVVREYVSADDKVFAISWHGPFMPDLQQILGGYYPQFLQAASAPHSGHRHLTVTQPGLVVESNGRMHAFYGRAWAPDLMPKTFSAADIN
jgi:uncharacterized protein DUF2844